MQLTSVASVLGLLASALAANSATYNTLAAVMPHGTELQAGRFYQFEEYWPAKGKATDCVSGHDHVRLVVVEVTGTKGNMDINHNDAWATDLFTDKDGQLTDPTVPGATNNVRVLPWQANGYTNKQGQFVAVENTYKFVSEVNKDDVSEIKLEDLGSEWCGKHPKYNINNANCLTLVKALEGEIKIHKRRVSQMARL